MINPLDPKQSDSIKPGSEVPEPPYVTGGPPFPQFPTDDRKHGISILDYFAAYVISGLCARQNTTIDDLKLDGARDAYWIAAQMVSLRGVLPIEPTPAPPEDVEDTGGPDTGPPLPVVVPPDELHR